MAENVSLSAFLKLLQSLVLVLLSQLVISAYGQKKGFSGDMGTMLKIRDELLATSENRAILQDWKAEDFPCNWTRVDCEQVGSSVVVRRIDLNHRNLTGPVPSSIGLLLNLTDITADGNLFSSIPQGFFQAKQLRLISFRKNLINGTVLDKLTTFQSLRVLSLAQNLISGRIDPLARLNRSAVEVIDLAGNKLQGSLITFSGFSRLISLRLGQNQLSGDLGTLEQLTAINDVSLEENNFNGTIPTSIISRMISVNLSRNSLQGSFKLNEIFIPGFISSLDLSENRLLQVVPEVQKLGNLNSTKSGGLDFFWARAVSKISLGANGLTGNIVSFPESTSTLNLSHNMLSGSLPDDTRATFYANVETLLLNNNSLSGPMPQSFWNMEKAVTVDLSGNHFNGGLPVGAIFMPSLQKLNLSRNSFSGPIPSNFSNLIRNFSLRIIDFSFNNFSGPVPQDLPQGQGFIYSFVGNPGLCSDEDFFRRDYSLPQCSKPSKAAEVARWTGVAVSLGFVLLLTTTSLGLWRLKVARDNEMDGDLVRAVNCGVITTRLIPLKELQNATSSFADEAKIGEGGFGSVYKGIYDGKKVAIKKSSNGILHLTQSKQMFMNEVQILSAVSHHSLVSLVGCCMTRKHALLVFEYIPQGTLAEHLHFRRGEGLDWNQRLKIALQTAEALSYLHFMADPPVYHRDVKSANILLDDDLNAKVADFGISKLVPYPQFSNDHVSTTTVVEGTPGYVDPEYYISFRLTDKSDVYSFGVVLLELITSRAPLDFRRGERDNTLVKMATHLVRTNALHLLVDPMLVIVFDDDEQVKKSILSVADLALRCVHRNPLARPDMQEVATELGALSSVQFHSQAHTKEEDDEFIPTAYPVSFRGPSSLYESANASYSSGSMDFRLGLGR
ncbi:hypothetical protein R1sor_011554 [Riccia sorocarpa]|uniref:Protein kinase domain-containing protein n=1 Tax=Riccia sorocarpa TaxID=122646 RepID=A0ABD3I1L2_9MARC